MERLVLAEGLEERLVLVDSESATVLEERPALEADHLELIPPIRLAPHLSPVARKADPLWLGN